MFADQDYCGERTQNILKKNQCHSGAIHKNKMKGKDFRKEAWLIKARMPFEGVFSKFNKKTRQRELQKVQFQVAMQAISHNLRKFIKIDSTKLNLVGI